MWKPDRTRPDGVRRTFSLPSSRDRMLRDAEEEMQFHIEMWKQDLRSRGMSDADADAEAWRRFGDPRTYREHTSRRAIRKTRVEAIADWLAEWMQDIRFAARHFRKSPAFTAVAVLTLALGIGANTAIFSVVHHLLISPLPYPNGDRVVTLKITTPRVNGNFAGLASIDVDAPRDPPRRLIRIWKDRAQSFDMIAGAEQVYLALDADGQQDTVSHAFITSNLLPMLGVSPALGRGFRGDEELDPKRNVAMISYNWWQRAFNGRDDVLGKTMSYEGRTYSIIGVMPPGLSIPLQPTTTIEQRASASPDMWLPASIDSVSIAFGRLRSGVGPQQAAIELKTAAQAAGPIVDRFRGTTDSMRVHVMRAQDLLAPRAVTTIEILFAAVGALLLIACANVANLLLVRAWSRRREFAVRLGLGAGRARLVRLALTESVMLALVAGALGMAIAWQSLHVIIRLRPSALESLSGASISPAVLFWTAAVSVGTGVIFGSVAAFFVGSQSVADVLRNEVRTSSGGSVARRVRATLIIAQIGLSFALLVGTGLLIRSFVALQERPIGFEPRNLVSVDMLASPSLKRDGRIRSIRDEVAARLRQTPGVVDAAIGTVPTAGWRVPGNLVVATNEGERLLGTTYSTNWISKEYFHTTGIAIAGRLPNPHVSDTVIARTSSIGGSAQLLPPPPGPMAGPPQRDKFRSLSEEIVINRALARRIAADGNALGARIRVSGGQLTSMAQENDWSTVVGIADDVHLPGAQGDLNDFQVYTLPLARMPDPAYVVHFASTPINAEAMLRHTIQTVNPTLVVRWARMAEDYVRDALAPTRFMLALLGAFSIVALVLSVVGLYGSIAYAVSQRTREIGIRIALGASSRSVTSLVLEDGLRLLVAGLFVGIATAVLSTRALSSLLYAVQASDPATFVTIGGIVAGVAVIASYIPARRAARIDPVDALRAD